MEILQEIKQGLIATSLLEYAAVTLSICYVIFIAFRNQLGWCFAFLSSAFYVYLSYSVSLYIESGLQIFYLIMAVYGWISWNKVTNKNNFIKRWPLKTHLLSILISIVISILLGYLMDNYTRQESSYLNAFTTVFSLLTTYMATQRILENWLYWIIIDSALVFLYANQGLYLIGVNYLIYSIIAIFAYFSWHQSFKKQTN